MFLYRGYEVVKIKLFAVCRTCSLKITDRGPTTTNDKEESIGILFEVTGSPEPAPATVWERQGTPRTGQSFGGPLN